MEAPEKILLASVQDQIRHEESMIHNRISWMLTFQGFLFASVAVISNTSADTHIRSALINIIPLLGAMVAGLTFLGIAAAYMHMGEIRSKNKEQLSKNIEIDFGAKGAARWMGRANSGLLPVIIFFTWIKLYYDLT